MSVCSIGPLPLALFGSRDLPAKCRIRARMLSQRTASGLRDSRPRSDPYSRVRGHVTHWNRKHLYKPSGTEICSQSDSSCQRRSQISDFIEKIQTLRAFCFLLGSFFFFFITLFGVRSCPQLCVLRLCFSSYLI